MKTHVGHLVYSVDSTNLAFYKDLLVFLGWQIWYDSEQMLGLGDGEKTSIWFGASTKDTANDYDGPGLNHLGIGTETQGDVDAAAEYLQSRGVALLFDTPRHRPDFAQAPETYYQIMFESPDRILFEIVYTGPMDA
jgi:catechol 2,3-dioxygenase-like lactoylglutathione lyase family enzyme